MSEFAAVLLGTPDGEHLELRVHSRAYPGGLRLFDDNWLNVEAVARTTERSWRFLLYLRTEDMVRFAEQLAALIAGGAPAAFESVDGWLDVRVGRDADVFALDVYAREGHTEKVTRFSAVLEAPALADLASAVGAVATAYPVVRRSEKR
jgi:hypothetical protein